MFRDYLLQDPAISLAMARGTEPGENYCHCCGTSLDGYDGYEIESDFFGNWYCPECWEEADSDKEVD